MKYKNVTDQELVVIGVGVVKAGGEIETDQDVNSQNLQIIEKPAKAGEKESNDK